MSLFRRATPEQLAASGKTKQLIKQLRPREADLVESRGQGLFDLNLDRRLATCRVLAEVDGEEVTTALADRLTDPVAELRIEAVGALLARDGDHEQRIVDAVLAWPETEARSQAEALLVGRFEEDSGDAATFARAYLSSGQTEDWTLDDEWVEQLVSATNESEREALMKRAAERSAGTRARQILAADNERGAEALIHRLADDASRLEVAPLLGQLRHTRATLPLVGMLEDREPSARRAAAEALGKIQDPVSVPALLRRSADNDFDVRNAAQRALDSFGTAGIIYSVSAAANGALEAGDGQPGLLGTGAPDDAQSDDAAA